ncbi:rhomboid family intramembrane serine protease [Frankia sp. AgB1.9]|uniref:rhomboid family intramembrane serine protease n=1 Tax=unclassified Frankia TaxID=2632575 RepID=UPI0019344FB7|nr:MULTISPECIES: rhomboid family intramembrane serine protease [unclassified Frankia]MBL7489896.1 rhomboid family intramembrane serine protease [Frankia sp. AgW1.1]MBL7549853.1 rhomboid family intramembrane serine protease [Frankia sp. AgB1.9]MBL7618416.1 rhomboid family intramembrane serine protease [Frankia sp. AgB1.8]
MSVEEPGGAASGSSEAEPASTAAPSPWERPTGAGTPPTMPKQSEPGDSAPGPGHQQVWGAPQQGGSSGLWARDASGMPVWEEADEPSGRSTPGSGHPAPGVPAGGQSGQSNRCYRHPDRDAFVSCQRCGRPICPDCMRPAAVGFHCPEEAAAARTPASPTQFGGRADRDSSGLITKILIGICLVAYVLEGVPGLTGTSHVNQFTLDYSLIGVDIAQKHEYWRLVTAAFLHGSVLHIAFNMYALFLLGTQLEAILGRVRYLALFFACAIGGNTLSYVIHDEKAFSYGASTAIFGFFAAYYLIARRLRVNTNQILIVVGINLLITFSISGIDKWGHIGGLATGVVLGLLYAYVPARRVAIQALGTAAVLAILIVAAVLNTQSLTALHTF